MSGLLNLDFARHLARAAANETLPKFRNNSDVVNKVTDGFDPVTEADKAAEKVIRQLIRERFPLHGIIGEEFGTENEESDYLWVIDPIDGTRSFIAGVPLWGTLVGLVVEGKAVAGMMSQPFTGELYFSDGAGALYDGPGGQTSLSTRKTDRLEDATLCTTSPFLFAEDRKPRYDAVERSVRLSRYSTDCYGYALLAAGHIDLVVESGLNPYDIVAMIPIVEQAGGVITTWDGGPAENGGDIVAAATQRLHSQALEILNR